MAGAPNESHAERRRRAARRRARVLPMRRFRLGEEPLWDERLKLSVDERLALVLELSVEQWRLSGRAMPDFEWENAPGRLRGLGEDAPG